MVFRNVIPDITVLGHSFVFCPSCFQVSASPSHISSLGVSTFDSVHHSLSVVRLYNVLLGAVTVNQGRDQGKCL